MTNARNNIVTPSKLELGNYEFDFQLDNAYFSGVEKTELLGGNVSVHARLALREEDYDLTIRVKGSVQVTCDRCLDPMDVSMDAEETVEPEDEQNEIDLNWLAYELIVINLPLVHRHHDGGCNPQMDALLQNHLCSATEEPEND